MLDLHNISSALMFLTDTLYCTILQIFCYLLIKSLKTSSVSHNMTVQQSQDSYLWHTAPVNNGWTTTLFAGKILHKIIGKISQIWHGKLASNAAVIGTL